MKFSKRGEAVTHQFITTKKDLGRKDNYKQTPQRENTQRVQENSKNMVTRWKLQGGHLWQIWAKYLLLSFLPLT